MHKLATAFLISSVALAADESLPKAETILDHFVEVTGGKAAYEKRHNQVEHGTLELTGKGIKGVITIYQAGPNKDLAVIEIEGIGKIESGGNGEVAWEKSVLQGARIKQGQEKADALRDATFNAPLHWRELYAMAETTGTAAVDSHECYKVVLTPKEGKPITQYYDKQSGLLLKSTTVRTTPMGDIAAEVLLDDYQKEGDMLSPHKVINKAAGQEFQVRITSTEVNVDLPKDRFDLPDDIRALLSKSIERLPIDHALPEVPYSRSRISATLSAGGKFTVYMSGKPLASETYTLENSDGKLQLDGSGSASLGTIKIDIEQFKVVADDKYNLISANAKAKLGTIPMIVDTTFADGKAKNEINTGQGPKAKEDTVHPDAIVVNENLPLYPWSVLALRTSFETRDPQTFPVYIIGKQEVTGQVTYKGRESVEFAGKTADLHHITASGTLPSGTPISLDFWTDDNHKLIKLVVPSQHVEAYQDGYEPKPGPPKPAPTDSTKQKNQ